MQLGSYVINDFRKINKTEILKKVRDSTTFSFSFIILLIGSSVVCTLGLLLNSTAVVIGGMIISPLMWPLMQTSLGISYGRSEYIRRALLVLFVATAVSLLTAILITFVSPLKIINAEILARTNPTLIDIVIAMVAGGVAALAITQPKISESLAGVAIATSLMPPLCVSGIGLALLNMKVFYGGLLLYSTNIVSIVFISVLAFLWLGVKSNAEENFQKRALGVTALLLLIIAIPLFIILRQVSFSTIAYSKAEAVLNRQFASISEGIFVSSLNVSPRDDDTVLVEAEVLVPDDVPLTFSERQLIQSALERELSRKVDLRLRLQNTISLLSKTDIEYNSRKDAITDAFISKLSELKPSIEVDRIDIYQNASDQMWILTGVLIGDPSTDFVYSEQKELETFINETISEEVLLDLDIVSRIRIKSDPDTYEEKVKDSVQLFSSQLATPFEFQEIVVTPQYEGAESSLASLGVSLNLILSSNQALNYQDVSNLQTSLSEEFAVPVTINLSVERKDTYLFEGVTAETVSLETANE